MNKLFAQTKSYIVVLLAALIVVVLVLYLGLRPVSDDKAPVRVAVARGTSAKQIAGILSDRGLIRSPFVFVLTCRVSGSSGKLKPGVYELSPSMSASEIIKQLVAGESLESWVTLPEGFTIRQIADELAARQIAGREAFLRLALTQGYEFPGHPFIYGHNLEGYLFPDTYLIARGTGPDTIIEKMLDAFGKKVVSSLKPEIEGAIRARFGLGPESFSQGLHRILTLASLVEREAKIPKDRPLVAAVLWNRLKKDMRLEVDASVSYSPGKSTSNKERVYYDDLESESPYNTYKHDGLPPAPICNPGLAAIKAVLRPASVDYLFYVARPDGSHVFSRTFEEHTAAKKTIR